MRRGRRCRERARIEYRAESGSVVIDGYVNVTGRESRPIPDRKGGYFVERIRQGAFGRALRKASEVKALLNHNWNKVIGSTNNNLTLREDVVGLRAHLETNDPEVVKAAKEKRLRGWSFNILRPSEERAELSSGMPLRTITDFDMSEVSLITDGYRPWYESTTVEARAEGEEEVEIRAEEFEAEYIGFEDKKEKSKPDNSKLKELIKKYGGNV